MLATGLPLRINRKPLSAPPVFRFVVTGATMRDGGAGQKPSGMRTVGMAFMPVAAVRKTPRTKRKIRPEENCGTGTGSRGKHHLR